MTKEKKIDKKKNEKKTFALCKKVDRERT